MVMKVNGRITYFGNFGKILKIKKN